MKYINGFFQLNIQGNGVYAHIYPEQEGGKPVDTKELAEYLDNCGISGYNLPDLNNRISQAKEETDIFISSEKISEVDETAKVHISDDGMMAFIRFYPPSKGGNYMTAEDIVDVLEQNNVKFGISNKVVQAYLRGRQFCRDIPIAKGKPVVHGKDAYVDYKFDTAPTAKPKLLEDGTVDFHELNMFTSVMKGDLLAELIPEKKGEPGMDVRGDVINPHQLKKVSLKFGRNIRLSEDQMKIFSEVDGDVSLEDDTVFVSDTYTVPADVDTSTGDIHYAGNVIVTGNVRAGFRVEAEGNIEVRGVVEGATVIAAGSIVLKRGVQGMGKGFLQAGTDIVTKFIESCEVQAGQTINTGSSLHSDLVAGEKVIVSGRKGFLIGGTISAGKRIEASVFGNKMNTVTTLKVGVEPEILERYKALATILKEKQEEAFRNQQILETVKKKLQKGQQVLPNQMMAAKQAGEALKQLTAELKNDSAEYKMLKETIEENKLGRVVANHTIFPGVCIYISSQIYPVKDVRSRCQFCIKGAEIVSLPI
ncbi:MAG: FapA family protein [Lachnospiraceae bacterium]|nr:FapA family protein [Lachnospiraceae bacterium]